MVKSDNKGGLNSLLSDSDLVIKNKVASFGGVIEIDINLLDIGKQQPRTIFEESLISELAASIKQHGLIQPITVRPNGKERYEIISGERRFRASKEAGLDTIPVYIRHVDDQASLEMAIVENVQRENLNPIEIALSFRRMIEECDLSQEELSQRVGKSRPAVSNYLRLLNLPTEIQSAMILGVLSMGQAKPLITLTDKNLQAEIYHRILDHDLSAREIEALVKNGNTFEAKANALDLHKEDMRIEQLTLQKESKVPFDLQVQDIDKGSVRIKFSSLSELDEIVNLLQD
jgi:ParB family transcriptional regulator, chromosome partitioning protein